MTTSDAEQTFLRHCFQNGTARELYFFVVGEELGSGVARRVYEYKPNADDTVIKIEDNAGSFQNVKEWETWHALRETAWGKRWLAPCTRISPCGIFLMQERTYAPGPDYKWPAKLPWVFTDRKKENFGLLKGRLVCHDYGTLNTGLAKGAPLKKLDKAGWWSDKD